LNYLRLTFELLRYWNSYKGSTYSIPLLCFGDGGTTRSLPRNRGAEEFRGDPTIGPRPMYGPEIKDGRSSAKVGVPERLRCGTIQKEVKYILQLMQAGAARKFLCFILHRYTHASLCIYWSAPLGWLSIKRR